MTTPAPHFVQTGYTHESFNGPACALNVRRYGLAGSPSVLMTSSILASSQMWHEQALLLSACGFQVLALDTRGHGDSKSNGGAYHMNDLVADSVSVLDHFGVSQAHYIGLSLGGMSGFGLAQQHANRLLSLILCDCRTLTGCHWQLARAFKFGCFKNSNLKFDSDDTVLVHVSRRCAHPGPSGSKLPPPAKTRYRL
jgi:pimeloyl-ACP methyl ester carboxylesterase